MLTVQPESSKEQRIRNEFSEVGGNMSTAEFAQHCLNSGVWTETEILRFTLTAAQSEVRSALKKHDVAGLAFAGKTTRRDKEGSPVWMQRVLWTADDYDLNIGDLIKQGDALYNEADKMTSERISRFGPVLRAA